MHMHVHIKSPVEQRYKFRKLVKHTFDMLHPRYPVLCIGKCSSVPLFPTVYVGRIEWLM